MRITITREMKRTPAWVNEEVARAGGYNVFGMPYFRVVWGWARLTLIGGWFDDNDENGRFIRRVAEYRHIPKYYPLERWHIEKWVPPTTVAGSPAAWNVLTREEEDGRSFQAMGAFPSRGEYEHCFTLYNPKFPPGDKRSYLGLDRETCGYIVRAVQSVRYLVAQDNGRAIYKEAEAKEKRWDSYADSILNDDNQFGNRAHIYVPTLSEVLKLGTADAPQKPGPRSFTHATN